MFSRTSMIWYDIIFQGCILICSQSLDERSACLTTKVTWFWKWVIWMISWISTSQYTFFSPLSFFLLCSIISRPMNAHALEQPCAELTDASSFYPKSTRNRVVARVYLSTIILLQIRIFLSSMIYDIMSLYWKYYSNSNNPNSWFCLSHVLLGLKLRDQQVCPGIWSFDRKFSLTWFFVFKFGLTLRRNFVKVPGDIPR